MDTVKDIILLAISMIFIASVIVFSSHVAGIARDAGEVVTNETLVTLNLESQRRIGIYDGKTVSGLEAAVLARTLILEGGEHEIIIDNGVKTAVFYSGVNRKSNEDIYSLSSLVNFAGESAVYSAVLDEYGNLRFTKETA